MSVCYHESTEIRFKVSTLGVKMYQRQCLACGLARSQFLKRQDVNEAAAQPWDKDLEQATWRQVLDSSTEERRLYFRQKDDKWRIRYERHLRSDKWAIICEKICRRDNGTCQGCLDSKGHHVHHLTYDRMGDELLIDLVLLCRTCHAKVHPHMTEGYDDSTSR